MQFHATLETKMLGNALLIEGDLLKPGVYVGLDGVPTKYSEEFCRKIDTSHFIGQPIKFAHVISPESMSEEIPKGEGVGYWTGVAKNGKIRVRGYVFDRRAIAYAKQHPSMGLSMEADVATSSDSDSFIEAIDGMLTGGVLIDDPACPTCKVVTAREVNLQGANTGAREEKKSETMSSIETAEKFIEYTKDENLAKPTRESFFTWIEDQMKKSGIPENIVPKAIAVLKKAVKVPYPYPYPKAQEMLEAEYGKDLAAEITTFLSAYTQCVGKEIKGGKSMAEAAAICKKQAGTEEKQQEQASMEKTPLEKDVEALMTELNERRAAESQQLNQDISGIATEIKALEKDFDPVKYVEGITCKKLQKKMLQGYLNVLKRAVKPIRLQIADDNKQAMVKGAVEEMFGEGATFESVFEVEEGAK